MQIYNLVCEHTFFLIPGLTYSLDWARIHDPSGSVSQRLGLQVCATIPGSMYSFILQLSYNLKRKKNLILIKGANSQKKEKKIKNGTTCMKRLNFSEVKETHTIVTVIAHPSDWPTLKSVNRGAGVNGKVAS